MLLLLAVNLLHFVLKTIFACFIWLSFIKNEYADYFFHSFSDEAQRFFFRSIMKINSPNECFGSVEKLCFWIVPREIWKETCNIVNCMNLEQTWVLRQREFLKYSPHFLCNLFFILRNENLYFFLPCLADALEKLLKSFIDAKVKYENRKLLNSKDLNLKSMLNRSAMNSLKTLLED